MATNWCRFLVTSYLTDNCFSFFLKGSHQPPKRLASQALTSCYWFFIVTTLATFSANLTAETTVKKIKPFISSLEDLATHPDYQAGLATGGSIQSVFEVTTHPDYQASISAGGSTQSVFNVTTGLWSGLFRAVASFGQKWTYSHKIGVKVQQFEHFCCKYATSLKNVVYSICLVFFSMGTVHV